MKICIVSSEYPPFSGGGIGTYSAITSRVLAEAGHEVHVIANAWVDDAGGEDFRLELTDTTGRLRIHRIPALDKAYRPCVPFSDPGHPLGAVCRERECSLFWSLMVADKLTELAKEHDIEVVEYPECFAEAYVALQRRGRVAAPIDLPTTITLHSPIREIAEFNMLQRSAGWVARRGVIEDHAILLADTVSSPSRLLGEMVYTRLGLDPSDKPLTTIPNSMDFDRLDGLTGWAAWDRGAPPRILYVGRIEPRKGVRELVDAALLLLRDHPKLVVELVGQDCEAGSSPGSMRESLMRRIPEKLQKSFIFTDKLPRQELFARFAAATACVFPPRWDNFPYTCCEAMAAGACVIVSSNSGMAEMVEHEKSGLVVDAGDVGDVARAVSRVLTEPGLAATLRSGATPRIRGLCDPARVIPLKLSHYEETIEQHKLKKKARRTVVARSKKTKETVALLVDDHRSEGELRATVRSARIAARRAGLELDLHVVASSRKKKIVRLLPEASVTTPAREGEPTALEQSLEKLEESSPTYIMSLNPGETVAEEYFETVLRVIRAEPDVAWVTTWALPTEGVTEEPFAGFDFSVPLEMMYYHPVPFALIRFDRFLEVGGWNTQLPDGWMQWDLWLALLQKGQRGVVVPVWQARHHPSSARPRVIEHGKAYELVLEAISERNRELFREHGASIWIAGQVSRTCPPSVADSAVEPAPALDAEPEAPEVSRQEHFDLLLHLADAVVDASGDNVGEAAFFSAHRLGGRTLMAHPPASIRYDVDIAERSFLNLSLSMHPSTYEQPGGGVRFTVLVDDEAVLDETADPKNDPKDRGWKDVSIDLGRFAGQRTLELRTAFWPEKDGRFATAGWGRAHLAAEPFAPAAESAGFTLRQGI